MILCVASAKRREDNKYQKALASRQLWDESESFGNFPNSLISYIFNLEIQITSCLRGVGEM